MYCFILFFFSKSTFNYSIVVLMHMTQTAIRNYFFSFCMKRLSPLEDSPIIQYPMVTNKNMWQRFSQIKIKAVNMTPKKPKYKLRNQTGKTGVKIRCGSMEKFFLLCPRSARVLSAERSGVFWSRSEAFSDLGYSLCAAHKRAVM